LSSDSKPIDRAQVRGGHAYEVLTNNSLPTIFFLIALGPLKLYFSSSFTCIEHASLGIFI
jgi:hypothetical protein